MYTKIIDTKSFQMAVFSFASSCKDLFYLPKRQWSKTCALLVRYVPPGTRFLEPVSDMLLREC